MTCLLRPCQVPGIVSAVNCGIRSCSADTWVDVPVVQVVDCVSAGGASNSVHRQSSWTFQYAQRQGFSAGLGGDVGLGSFRAPLGPPRVERQFWDCQFILRCCRHDISLNALTKTTTTIIQSGEAPFSQARSLHLTLGS